MYGYIYKTTNLLNNKIYVGQHKVTNDKFDTSYYGSGKLLLEAVKKYGVENFNCELIEWCDSFESLNEREIYWIKELNSSVRNGNYNISDEGFVPRLCGELNGNYGKHRPHTEEEKAHLSRVTKGHKPTFTGKHTEQTKMLMSKISRENNLKRGIEVYGKVSETAKGNKMMNKGDVCKRVHPEQFDEYLSNGWVFGGLSRKGKYKNRNQKKPDSCTTKDKIAVTNEVLNKFIPKEQLNDYLQSGWRLGLRKRAN